MYKTVKQQELKTCTYSVLMLLFGHAACGETASTITNRVAPNLTFSNSAEAEFGRISELKFGRSQNRIWLKLVFWSENNMPVIKLMASTMLSAAIEALHFSASCVALLFASY